ncbi:hypothetical protein RvY_04626 [Ramazzottius varieornatus]|uniref:Uncharacterized protein n=1 Tax=Ramazzottius varieornatus TaxID=947166 RepID=A0A1D1UXY6_RAMVA|nr:hypothetical protein RvY_04626 [Ramazzottius varieornatus]
MFSAPVAPITSCTFRNAAVVLTNPTGQRKPQCKEVAGRGKVACDVDDHLQTRGQHVLAIYYTIQGWRHRVGKL